MKPLKYEKPIASVQGAETIVGGVKSGGSEEGSKRVGGGLPDPGVEAAPVEPGEEPAGTIRKLEGGGYQIKAVGAGWITCAKDRPGLRLADFYRSHHLE